MQGQIAVQTTTQAPLHSTPAAIVYTLAWVATVFLFWIPMFIIVGFLTNNGYGGGFDGSAYIPYIITAIFGFYSNYSWFRAAGEPTYVPNSAALIGAIVAVCVFWFWMIYVTIVIRLVVEWVRFFGCTAQYAHFCTSVEVLLIGAIAYNIMSTATLVIICVDHVAYFGCCCNGTGRVGGGAVTTTVVVQQQPVQMQQQTYGQPQQQTYGQPQQQTYGQPQQYSQQPMYTQQPV
jgi:hypothetical protein